MITISDSNAELETLICGCNICKESVIYIRPTEKGVQGRVSTWPDTRVDTQQSDPFEVSLIYYYVFAQISSSQNTED